MPTPLHVLIVASEPAYRHEIRDLLDGDDSYPVVITQADSAEAGIAACRLPHQERPAVVLLDLGLVGETGVEWLNAVRGKNGHLPASVVIMGGVEETDPRIEQALAAGAQDYVSSVGQTSRRLRRRIDNALTRHQLFQRLAESEAHFRAVADAAPVLIWVSDLSKGRTFFNTTWLEFTGRTMQQELGIGWLEGVHPDDYSRCLEIYTSHFDRHQPFEMEYRLCRHDGTYRWLLDRGLPRFNPDGEFVGYTGSCIDVTERREVEDDLRVSEERFRLVLQGTPIMVFAMDRDLRFTWVYNPPPPFTIESMLGKRDDEILPPDVAAPFLAVKQETIEQGVSVHREVELVWGPIYYIFELLTEPQRDEAGNVIGLVAMAMNVTERVQAESQLRFLAEASRLLSSSLSYEETLKQVGAALVPHLADWFSIEMLTPENTLENVAIAHVDPAKLEWAQKWRVQHPTPMDSPTGTANVIRTGKSEFYPEIPLDAMIAATEDEDIRQVLRYVGFKSAMVVPLTARQQTLGAITLVWSDSDRRYSEADLAFAEELARRAAIAIDNARLYRDAQESAAQLFALTETLEQRVAERTHELQRSNQELDQFTYVASHDLKAPLRALEHLSTWVMEDAGHLLPTRSHEHLNKMRGRIRRMEGLLEDLLAYSRAGRHRGEATLVNINELVQRVVETVAPPQGFKVTITGTLPVLYTQHVPLETVMRNLINNAIKHHDKPSGHIEIWAEGRGSFIEFAVRDDGPGIEPLFHDRIFQMFQTLRPRDQVEGSGIGLSVVKKIVESMGGKITVESEVGKGATFRFTWPVELTESLVSVD